VRKRKGDGQTDRASAYHSRILACWFKISTIQKPLSPFYHLLVHAHATPSLLYIRPWLTGRRRCTPACLHKWRHAVAASVVSTIPLLASSSVSSLYNLSTHSGMIIVNALPTNNPIPTTLIPFNVFPPPPSSPKNVRNINGRYPVANDARKVAAACARRSRNDIFWRVFFLAFASRSQLQRIVLLLIGILVQLPRFCGRLFSKWASYSRYPLPVKRNTANLV
jgi:hypothetical protein